MKTSKDLYSVPNMRQICATWLPATNTRDTRVKIFEPARGNDERQSFKVFSYDYQFNSVQEQAYAILLRNGVKVVCRASDKDKYIFLCDSWGEDFKAIKDLK